MIHYLACLPRGQPPVRHTMHLNTARPVPHNRKQLEVVIAGRSPA
jgi:hypothetical protein